MPYIYNESELFAERISKIKRKDLTTFNRIKSVIGRILKAPQNFDRSLHGDKKCKFEKYVGRNLARIVYTWCRQCRTSDCSEVNACGDCGNKLDNTVMFFDVFYKHEANKLGY